MNAQDAEVSALAQWWQRHCREFSLWFLSLTYEKQAEIVTTLCPDIRRKHRSTSDSASESSAQDLSIIDKTNEKMTHLLLPELVLEDLLASQGRILVLFMTRRCTSPDGCLSFDLQQMFQLSKNNQLPIITEEHLNPQMNAEEQQVYGVFHTIAQLDTPFVDPADPEENVQTLDKSTTMETRNEISQLFSSGRLVPAAIWLWMKLRRTALTAFMVSLVQEYQKQSKIKPSPNFESLLNGEMKTLQQMAMSQQLAMQQQQQAMMMNDNNNNNSENYNQIVENDNENNSCKIEEIE